MSLTVILLFGVFVFPILLGIMLLKTSRKVALAFLSVPFIFIIGVVAWWFVETNYRFVGSTDLAGEQIGELAIEDPVDEGLLAGFGDYDLQDNINYHELYIFDDLKIGSSVREQIIYIHTDKADYATAKGIRVGDSLDQVKEAYGKKSFNRRDMGMGASINYVDRAEKLHLQFWLEDDQVVAISLQAI